MSRRGKCRECDGTAHLLEILKSRMLTGVKSCQDVSNNPAPALLTETQCGTDTVSESETISYKTMYPHHLIHQERKFTSIYKPTCECLS